MGSCSLTINKPDSNGFPWSFDSIRTSIMIKPICHKQANKMSSFLKERLAKDECTYKISKNPIYIFKLRQSAIFYKTFCAFQVHGVSRNSISISHVILLYLEDLKERKNCELLKKLHMQGIRHHRSCDWRLFN